MSHPRRRLPHSNICKLATCLSFGSVVPPCTFLICPISFGPFSCFSLATLFVFILISSPRRPRNCILTFYESLCNHRAPTRRDQPRILLLSLRLRHLAVAVIAYTDSHRRPDLKPDSVLPCLDHILSLKTNVVTLARLPRSPVAATLPCLLRHSVSARGVLGHQLPKEFSPCIKHLKLAWALIPRCSSGSSFLCRCNLPVAQLRSLWSTKVVSTLSAALRHSGKVFVDQHRSSHCFQSFCSLSRLPNIIPAQRFHRPATRCCFWPCASCSFADLSRAVCPLIPAFIVIRTRVVCLFRTTLEPVYKYYKRQTSIAEQAFKS